MHKVFISGCGYIGERIARLYQESGADVTCMVRSKERAARIERLASATLVCSLDEADLPDFRLAGNTLFYLVPPPGGGIFDTRARYFCDALVKSESPSRIVYISSTSVYSERDGGIVTEKSPTEPLSAMGKRRLDAESVFQKYGATHDVPVIILRVSGIYGPDRLPLMQISQGQPLLREDESGPSNRIHADDLAAICITAASARNNGDVFNVSDGHPTSMTTYFNSCADFLGFPRQPQVSMEEARRVMSPLMFSYVSESKIIDNRRMLDCLKVSLRYPSLIEGLPASV